MEFFRRAIRQIKAQLGILTTSQRLVVILLLIIMCGAVLWMIKYAGQREMVPLLNKSLEENDLQSIVSKLDGWEQEYEVKGDRILVPKSDQKKLIARLAYDGLLPEDAISWAMVMQESDIWTPPGVRADRNLIIKQTELARIISQFPGVESAQVIINKAKDRRLSNIQPAASASVSVTTSRGSASERRLADSIAEFVSGANRNMSAKAVRVLINGNLVPILDEEQKMSANYREEKTQYERDYRAKIEYLLGIPDALVVVDVVLQITKTNQMSTTYMEEGKGTVNSTVETTTSEETSTENKSNNEPGVGANLASNQGTGGSDRIETIEKTTRKNDPSVGSTVERTDTPRGGVKDITATVRIPESYYEKLAKKRAPQGKDPTPADIQAVIDADLPEIKTCVLTAIHEITPEKEAQVVVNTYWDQGSIVDSASALADQASAEAGATGSVTGVARQYGKQIAVSALALLSLFMALMMVRRATSPVELDEEEATALMMQGKKPLDALSVEESNLAEGAEGGLLAGVELDDETVRSQQMLEQIKSMVQESPDSAATLISKWARGAE